MSCCCISCQCHRTPTNRLVSLLHGLLRNLDAYFLQLSCFALWLLLNHGVGISGTVSLTWSMSSNASVFGWTTNLPSCNKSNTLSVRPPEQPGKSTDWSKGGRGSLQRQALCCINASFVCGGVWLFGRWPNVGRFVGTDRLQAVSSKRQVPKPIKLLEGIGNGGNGALIQSTAILWTNDQHFILLRSTGVYGKSSSVDHLRIYHAHAGAHRFTSQC